MCDERLLTSILKNWRLISLSGLNNMPMPKRRSAVAISPDGQTIVSGSRDKTIKVWGVPAQGL